MSTTQGKFVWYDLMTSDSKAAESFYRSVIGWDAKDFGMADRSYKLFSAGPMMVGGLMPIPEEARAMGARPAWIGYVLYFPFHRTLRLIPGLRLNLSKSGISASIGPR